MTSARQIRAGLLQSWHLPSAAHGVLFPSRCAFFGAATFRARSTALARSGHSLFTPPDKHALLRPEQRSRHTVALAVDVNDFAVLAQRVRAREVNVRVWKYSPSLTQCQCTSVLSANASGKPIS